MDVVLDMLAAIGLFFIFACGIVARAFLRDRPLRWASEVLHVSARQWQHLLASVTMVFFLVAALCLVEIVKQLAAAFGNSPSLVIFFVSPAFSLCGFVCELLVQSEPIATWIRALSHACGGKLVDEEVENHVIEVVLV